MATAIAQPNFALIKYWGKAEKYLNIPAAGSISVTVDKLSTVTTVDFKHGLSADKMWMNGKQADSFVLSKIQTFLGIFRDLTGDHRYAEVISTNNFPTASGIASSSSGFAALTLAASHAIGLELGSKELSAIARRGSGSAARSIYGGFVEMVAGNQTDGRDSIARPIADENAWPMSILIALTSREPKKTGSTNGMNLTSETSPFYPAWIESTRRDLLDMKGAIKTRDFNKLGELMEHSCLKMHGTMLSARPGLIYWNSGTLEIIETVKRLRQQGHEAYFTIDAGPQVKIMCRNETEPVVAEALQECSHVVEIISTRPGPAARIKEGWD